MVDILHKLKNIRDADKFEKWQLEMKEMILEERKLVNDLLEKNKNLHKEIAELKKRIIDQDTIVENVRDDEKEKREELLRQIDELERKLEKKDEELQIWKDKTMERKLISDLRQKVSDLGDENINLAKTLAKVEELKKKALEQNERLNKKLEESFELFKSEKKADIPTKRLAEMANVKDIKLGERFFRMSEVTKDKRRALITMGDYDVYEIKDLKGRKIKVLMNKPVNETPDHFGLQNLVYQKVQEHTETAEMFIAVKPDVVFHVRNGTKVAFEVETGTALNNPTDFEKDKVTMLKRDYSDYYFIVTDASLKKDYTQYGKVLARHEVEGKLNEIFNE